jgi:site-specific recombinase XerD
MNKSIIVEDDQLDWLLHVTLRDSKQHGKRNVAMLLTLFGTGITPAELAGLRVSDALAPNGEFRAGQKPPRGQRSSYYEAEVRAEIAFNGYARPLRWVNKRLASALGAYLAERLEQHQGTWSGTGYRGLDPMSPLYLSRANEGFACRVSEGEDGKQRRQYSSLSNLFGRLFANAGIDGAVAGSARRTLAVKLKRRGTDIRVIAEILGNQSLEAVRKMVRGDTARLGEIIKDVV